MIFGRADDYIDLSNALVAAMTGSSLATAAPSAQGTGYVVGDVLTLSGGTSTVAATVEVTTVGGSGEVQAVRISNQGVYTANPSSPTAKTGGSGTGCTITNTFAQNGWTAEVDQTYSGSEREVILNGDGSGTDEIYVGWRTFSNPTDDYYNWELHAFADFDSGETFVNQPGVSPGFHDQAGAESGSYLLLNNMAMDYFFKITHRAVVGVVHVGTNYHNFMLGWGNRYDISTSYPKPLVAAGHCSVHDRSWHSSLFTSGLVDPWQVFFASDAGPMFVYAPNNAWHDVFNGRVQSGNFSAATDRVVSPTQVPGAVTTAPEEDRFASSINAFADWIPGTLISATPNALLLPTPPNDTQLVPANVVFSTPPLGAIMELPDVYWINAVNVQSEDRIIVNGDAYRVFQNCNRTDSYAHLAIKEL